MKTLEVATLMGARIIEKHFTYDKTLTGNDHYHAMDKDDLKNFHSRMDILFELLGDCRKRPLENEAISRANARRSLVASRDIPSGKRIEKEDITWKRPASGIDPREYERLLNCYAISDISADCVLQWKMFRD